MTNQSEGISKEVMGTTGLNNMVGNEPEQPSVDYQQKVLIDEETQEVHRKILEQIKETKERIKYRTGNIQSGTPVIPA